MSRHLLILASVFFFQLVNAQPGGILLKGAISTPGGLPAVAATISLLKAADSSLIKIGTTDTSGSFSFAEVKPGKYLLSVTAVNFRPYWSATVDIISDKNFYLLKTIVLTQSSGELAGVTIVARKPLIEQHIDRMVVNVDAAPSNIGASAMEVLEKSPGITVDKDGNISLKGKQGVRIFIDGKPAYLSGEDLANLLRNMNANQLDQIEIMTNPPAKYDASGNSGIINIKTKKNKVKGFNGSVTAGYSQGFYARTNESLTLNYRNGRLNTFLNYSYNRNKSYNQLSIHRTYRDTAGRVLANFDQVAFMPRTGDNHNLKTGVDFYASDKTTVGFVVSGFLSPENQQNFNTSYLKSSTGVVDSIVYSTSRAHNRWKNGALNLNFLHRYDSAGRELSADLDYSRYGSDNNQLFMNSSFTPDWVKKGQTDLRSVLPVAIAIYSAKMDYTHPLKKAAKLEAGLKTSYVNTDNAADYFNVVGSAEAVDYDKTNRFLYKENINAGYLNYSRQFKKFGVQAGLRFENTNYRGHQLGNTQKPGSDSAFSRSYNNLFPTVYLSYAAAKDHQLGLSAGRRIDRPDYEDLNPFLFFIDNYTYETGNPFLKPQYSNNIELSHTYKGKITTTVNYSDTKNFFSETFGQKDFATVVSRGNIGQRQNAGISISAQLDLAKWWSASLYGNYNYNHFKGVLYNEDIDIKGGNVLFNVNNQFTFSRGWSAELSGFYRTKGIEGQVAIDPLGQASAGIAKKVMKGKGNVRMSIRDIFFTNRAHGTINFQQTSASFDNIRDSRVAGISFTYRFGKPLKSNRGVNKKGGAPEEAGRVKAGNND